MNIKEIPHFLGFIIFLTLLSSATYAHASLEGHTINYSYIVPNIDTVYEEGAYMVPGGGVTISNIAGTYNTITILGNSLVVNYPIAVGPEMVSWVDAPFNGFRINAPDYIFSSFRLLSNTALVDDPEFFFDAHNLYVNWADIFWSANGGKITFAINTSAVPEVDAYILTLTGLGLVGVVQRRRKLNN